MRKILITVALLVTSLNAFSGGWTSPVDIDVVYAFNDTGLASTVGDEGSYAVYRVSDMSVNFGCTAGEWYVLPKHKNPIFDEIYSLMLASRMASQKVELFITGCSPHNHPVIEWARTVN